VDVTYKLEKTTTYASSAGEAMNYYFWSLACTVMQTRRTGLEELKGRKEIEKESNCVLV